MYYEFQIFGSKSSRDLDVMVYVDEISDKPHINHLLESELNTYIKDVTKTDKEVNSNLAIIKDGVISKVFKGCEDEVNNSLIKTYDLHKQYFPLKIEREIERDIDLKILRTCRVLLSLISRTQYRPIVKKALPKSFSDKVSALYLCDFSKLTEKEFDRKNVSYEDILKVYAFQIGQTLGLIEGYKLYTKEDIIEKYPELEGYILRDVSKSLKDLEKWKIFFLDKIKDRKMKSEYEYKYGDI